VTRTAQVILGRGLALGIPAHLNEYPDRRLLRLGVRTIGQLAALPEKVPVPST